MQKRQMSVSQINEYIKNLLESDMILLDIWVIGELTNVKAFPKGGQVYFTITDGNSQLNCVIYESNLTHLTFKLMDGLKINARGKIKLFHKKGYYVFQCNFLMQEGAGKLSLEFEQLKAKLLSEGLFDQNRKKAIPQFPETIGLITAWDSAAMWDFVKITNLNAGHIKLTVIPAIVQGERCANSVIQAINQADGKFDLLVIMRGGGSAEDLAGFNQEALIRRIAQCQTPIVSAIGHEVDYTLTDFVADVRMPTPTAAAQFIAQPTVALKSRLIEWIPRLTALMQGHYQTQIEQITELIQTIQSLIQDRHQIIEDQINALISRLTQTNPLHRMKQGYTITRLLANKKIIKSTRELSINQALTTEFQDGIVTSIITEVTV